jgi:iron(III) transport system substrate-binding protein
VKNFSRKPQGNDRAQILSVAAGESKLAIANTYYYALMLSGKKGDDQKKAAQKVEPIFPNQNDRGAHINISGAGILSYSPNKKNAQEFLEFLLTKEAQTNLCNSSFEFPIIQNVSTNKLINNIKNFKEDIYIDVSTYGKRQAQAFKLMKKAGWN